MHRYKVEILEFARLACSCIPDKIQYELDISDEQYTKIRDYIILKSEEIDPE